MDNIKLKFCGGVGETTGVNYLLTIGSDRINKKTRTVRIIRTNGTVRTHRVLIDCGMFQGPLESEKKNWDPFLYDPKEIEAVFITHAHLDHIGRLPKLYREGFRGKIYATAPTIDLAELSLFDAAHLTRNKAKDNGIEPFFEEKDVKGALGQFVAVGYNELILIGNHIEAELLNAGHILGSAMVRIQIRNPKSETNRTIKT